MYYTQFPNYSFEKSRYFVREKYASHMCIFAIYI